MKTLYSSGNNPPVRKGQNKPLFVNYVYNKNSFRGKTNKNFVNKKLQPEAPKIVEEKEIPKITQKFLRLKNNFNLIHHTNLELEKKITQRTFKTGNDGDTFKYEGLDEIYTLSSFTSNIKNDLPTFFDLENVKRNIEMCNRNLERNKLKESLKKSILGNMVIHSKTKSDKKLNMLHNINNIIESASSELTTHYNTEENFKKEEKNDQKIVSRFSLTTSFRKRLSKMSNFSGLKSSQKVTEVKQSTRLSLKQRPNSDRENSNLKKTDLIKSERVKKLYPRPSKTTNNFRNNLRTLVDGEADNYNNYFTQYVDNRTKILETLTEKKRKKQEYDSFFATKYKKIISKLDVLKQSKHYLISLGHLKNSIFSKNEISQIIEERKEIEIAKL